MTSMDDFNVLLGVASFLRGFMRMIVCRCIIFIEISNNLSLFPQIIMLVLFGIKDSWGFVAGCSLPATRPN